MSQGDLELLTGPRKRAGFRFGRREPLVADQVVETRGIGGDLGSTPVRPRFSVPGQGSGGGSEHHAVRIGYGPETLELSKSLFHGVGSFTRSLARANRLRPGF